MLWLFKVPQNKEIQNPSSCERLVKRHHWDIGNMAKAIEAIQRSEMGILRASKTFHVPYKTLLRLADKQYCTSGKIAKHKNGKQAKHLKGKGQNYYNCTRDGD